MILALTLLATPVYAAPITTPCSGSWDGPGLTACELIGREADSIGYDFDAHLYLPGFEVLWEITDYDTSNTLNIIGNGALQYRRNTGHITYVSNSKAHRNQFAYWFFPGYTIVGIEDLGGLPKEASDYDYNDYVVKFRHKEVPEPVIMVMLGLGLLVYGGRKRG